MTHQYRINKSWISIKFLITKVYSNKMCSFKIQFSCNSSSQNMHLFILPSLVITKKTFSVKSFNTKHTLYLYYPNDILLSIYILLFPSSYRHQCDISNWHGTKTLDYNFYRQILHGWSLKTPFQSNYLIQNTHYISTIHLYFIVHLFDTLLITVSSLSSISFLDISISSWSF